MVGTGAGNDTVSIRVRKVDIGMGGSNLGWREKGADNHWGNIS